MKRINPGTKCALALAIGAMVACAPALADKPAWAGGGKGESHGNQKGDQQGEQHGSDAKSSHGMGERGGFDERQRVVVNEYYTGQFNAGRCPPGLAKKHNGCMPPGQAKKWRIGQALPSGVRYYTVPQPLLTQFGPPPAGYQYVRVDSDILLLGTATRMVLDAISNLGRT